MRHPLHTADFLTAFATIVAGMALTFVALSSSSVSYRLLLALLALGAALTGLSLRSRGKRRRRDASTCRETLLVDAEASGEVIFAPESPMRDPVLCLSAHGRPVVVEDVWHEGVSLVTKPVPITLWRQGVTYPGVVDRDRPLRIVVRNAGYSPAAVRASLTTKKE